jgi:hypothetical protein
MCWSKVPQFRSNGSSNALALGTYTALDVHYLVRMDLTDHLTDFICRLQMPMSSLSKNQSLLLCDHEPISNVAVCNPLVSLIHFLNLDKLDGSSDVILTAEIKHLLRLLDSTDHRACKTSTTIN